MSTDQPRAGEAPVRPCCMTRHFGALCPDEKVTCCVCFERVSVDELAVDPKDGKPWDVCKGCEKVAFA